MNEDFSDVLNRFSDILKEKNINLDSITGGGNNTPPQNQDDNNFGIDIDTILRIKELIQELNRNQNCPRNKLLSALKPYLEPEKKEKLNQYIKIASIIELLENMDLGIALFKNNKKGYDYILIITLCLLIF